MKNIMLTFALLLLTIAGFSQKIDGAWQYKSGSTEYTLVFVDGYCSFSTFDLANKKFINTQGGPYTVDNNSIKITWEYNAEKAGKDLDSWLGKTASFSYKLDANLVSNITGQEAKWQRVDENKNALSGVWRITGRQQGAEVQNMPLRERRTLKILSGTRFQWAAINIKTGEFSGTGGGRYTFENGKYTEHIEFFSRDNSRVGSSLSFDAKVENGNWIHSGLSSSGAAIYEVWSKLEKQ
jgi:hypothetical protein